MKQWLQPEPVTVPHELRELVGGHPLVAETLVRRGHTTAASVRGFLDPARYEPTPPHAMPGMDGAVERLARALAAGERICVWGDFDVDGQTATTLLVSVLQDLGGDVIYHIPERATESHGVKQPWLAEELAKGVRVLLTCDTGIDAHEAVAYAKRQGVDVIITDHHELAGTLPDADAIVNPHLLDDGHPLSTLPGVGVAYKLAEALYEQAGRPERVDRLLDLVALGLVADVAVLTGDARYLLQRGLEALRATTRLGLQELMKLAHIVPAKLDEEDIGFGIAPRLNALGRLDDANVIVEFLTTQDLTKARILASQLESLNSRRRQLCDRVYAEAEAKVESDTSLLESPVLVLDDPRWHPGVIGIVANRLVERYHRPAVLIATPPGGMARGSARSISGCNITEAIATQESLLEGFGGHEMAAGLAIDPERIPALRRGLARAVQMQLDLERPEPVLQTHGVVALSDLTIPFVEDLERLAPFGPGNPPLVLVAPDLRMISHRQLGRTGDHLRVLVEDQEHVERSVVWWGWRDAPLPEGRFDLAFTARPNAYRGSVDVQLVWEDTRPVEPVVSEARPVRRAPEILDYRHVENPGLVLKDLLREFGAADGGVQIWAEGPDGQRSNVRQRHRLEPAQTLVVWSAPPGPEVLRRALDRVDPLRVALFAATAALDTAEEFLAYITGLAKYALRANEGRVNVPELAALAGHRELAVRLGLAWLEAKGYLQIRGEGGTMIDLSPGGSEDPDLARRIGAGLREALAETAAYRRFYLRADGRNLVDFDRRGAGSYHSPPKPMSDTALSG
ncbi:MAG: single-stranded-DNA-specific exonuclease RecJ, partial [Anaerolineae bacterium]